MNPRSKRALLQFFGLAVVVGTAAVIYFLYSFESWLSGYDIDDATAINITLKWGRLAPLPPSTQDLSVKVEGSPFTRGFRVSFVAPPADIERWLQSSPGTSEAKLTTPSAGIRHYDISPGGGAQYAEVTFDADTNRVSIYSFWS